MLVSMQQQVFDSLNDADLGWACIAPRLLQVRGKSTAEKSRMHDQLTPGQRALFLFYAWYNHARNSTEEFYWWCSHQLSEPRMWLGLESGVQHFGDAALLQVLDETKSFLEERNATADTWRDARPQDLDEDPALHASMERLNARFHELAPATLQTIAAQIRANPREYVLLEE